MRVRGGQEGYHFLRVVQDFKRWQFQKRGWKRTGEQDPLAHQVSDFYSRY